MASKERVAKLDRPSTREETPHDPDGAALGAQALAELR
jgi:hypothetical protein